MPRPLKGIPQYQEYRYIMALDIETSSKGKLLDIGVWTDDGYFVFGDWSAFFRWLREDFLDCDVRIIAHNGFGFDFVNMIPWLLDHLDELGIEPDDFQVFSSESLVVGAVIRIGKFNVELFDTIRLFTAVSLENLAKDFLGEGKREIPDEFKSKMEVFKRRYRSQYYDYLRRDCEALFLIYQKFRDEVNHIEAIGELGFSSGSTAFRTYRRYLGRVKPNTWIYSLPPSSLHVGDEALRGGLTCYIGDGKTGKDQTNFYAKVYSYDVVSMYPHAMMDVAVPVEEPEFTKKLKYDESGVLLPGYYLCEYEQTAGRVPFIKPLKSYGFDEPQWKGNALLSTVEINWLQHNGKIRIFEGIYFPYFEKPFRSFIERMMKAKSEAKAKGEPARAWAYKILANSLYGKFSQRAMKHIVAITGDMDWYHKAVASSHGDITEYYYNGDHALYGTDRISSSFSNRLIGATVTARARLKLGLIMNTVPTIYVDTDSIFTQKKLHKSFIGKETGYFELKNPDPQEMLCLGKKLYTYGDERRAKGVPSRSITYNDFQRLATGEKVPIKYHTPTALKTALQKNIKNPNEFTEKVRTLRKFPSLKEQGLLHDDVEFLDVGDVLRFLKTHKLL